jgi:dihydrofolate synthase/folylpolyglutamate synthase
MKLGLENISRLLAALGDPQNRFVKVQVAGTNGKGSVCAFLDAICCSAEVNVGVFTSPHLVSITERIRIYGRDITEEAFAKFATRVRTTAEHLVSRGELENRPTFFEQVTAIGLVAFAEAGVDLAILETGLGGRLDATTAAGAGICAITQIALDHQEYLGETIEEIAAEKAAIIHPGCEVVVAEQKPEAMKVILDKCDAAGVTPLLAENVGVTGGGNTMSSGCVSLHSHKNTYAVTLALAGEHQIANAKVAILLAELLQDHFPQITSEHIIAGLERARHRGRLETVGNILFDGAHNASGARALAAYLEQDISRPVTMIFGVMNDKDVREITEILFPHALNVILTRADNSRAMPPEEILAAVSDRANLSVEPAVANALRTARQMAGNEGLIVVTGSLYLVGEVKKLLNN